MNTAIGILQAATLLAPMVEELAKYLAGGNRPEWISTLPEHLLSEIALAKRRAEVARG